MENLLGIKRDRFGIVKDILYNLYLKGEKGEGITRLMQIVNLPYKIIKKDLIALEEKRLIKRKLNQKYVLCEEGLNFLLNLLIISKTKEDCEEFFRTKKERKR